MAVRKRRQEAPIQSSNSRQAKRGKYRRKAHNIYIARDRMKRRTTSALNKAKMLAENYTFRDHIPDPITGLFPHRVLAPEKFTLGDPISRARVLDFLEEVRYYVLDLNRYVFIDFSKTKKMIADGTLMLYAQLYRLVQITKPKRLITCSSPKNKIVAQVLQHVKVFDTLGKRKRTVVKHHTVKHWHSQTGTKHQGEKIEAISEFYERQATGAQDSSKLYNGISEAMINCKHGYPDAESLNLWGFKGDARWWMFSHELNGVLWVTIYDLGIGIPASIESGKKWSAHAVRRILSLLGLGKSDGELIECAFILGESVTGEAHRGKGLPEVTEVLRQHGKGTLRVYSGKGYYYYDARSDSVTSGNFSRAVRGTMISWNIPMQAIREEQERG